MARILESSQIDNLIKLYQSGLSLQDVAMRVGVNVKTADKYIRNRGVAKRTMAEAHKLAGAKLSVRDVTYLKRGLPQEAIDWYRSGVGVKEIAGRLGACAKRVARQLREAGIPVDKEVTIVRKFGPGARRQWAMKAGAAVTLDAADLARRALTREANQSMVGVMEAEFSQELIAHGIEVTQQLAVSSYNIDIALQEQRIAIEIHRGAWHGATSAKPERIEHLLDGGWRVVFVQISRHGAATDVGAITDKLVALAQTSGRNPSGRGQYGVLRRNGQPASRLPDYFYRWPRIPGF